MRKSSSRILFLGGILGFIFGEIVTFFASMNQTASSPKIALLILSLLLTLIGVVLLTIGWIGALIRTAQLARWGWFVCLLVFGPVTMFGYIFAGPTTPIAR
jgi:hypothetical protein